MCQLKTAGQPQWTWVCDPTPMADGSPRGGLMIRDGRGRPDFYMVTLLERDDMSELWRLEKETKDGYGPEHLVCVPAGGAVGPTTCTCDGWKWRRTCKHVQHLPEALEAAACV